MRAPPPTAAAGLIGPCLRDYPLAAVGQYDQQLGPATPARSAQHCEPLPLKGVPVPSDHHLGAAHRAPRGTSRSG